MNQNVEGGLTVAACKGNFRIHDPNPPAATAAALLKILAEANRGRVEAALLEALRSGPPASGGETGNR